MRYKNAVIILAIILTACTGHKNQTIENSRVQTGKIKILIDTDANNELDDQHALAYAFMNNDVFDVVGITVNNTINGEGIQGHYDEAFRIISLFNLQDKMPLKKGATGTYSEIRPFVGETAFDGSEAIDFIIEEAKKVKNEKLVLLPIGKLTNIALALLKAPEIKDKVRVVWLGSNYPDPGEYNLENDTSSVNPVIESGVEFEMVTVRYGLPSGTGAVTVTLDEIKANVAGKGPAALLPVTGRRGGEFKTFGDYSFDLFGHIGLHGRQDSRALFDMAAVAIVKNPAWAKKIEIAAPRLMGGQWQIQEGNPSRICYWENFDRTGIVNDFFRLISEATPK